MEKKINDVKSLDELSDKKLLQCVLSNQLHLIRKMDFLASKITDKEVPTHLETTKEMISKLESGIDRINDYLKLSDEEKGMLRL